MCKYNNFKGRFLNFELGEVSCFILFIPWLSLHASVRKYSFKNMLLFVCGKSRFLQICLKQNP